MINSKLLKQIPQIQHGFGTKSSVPPPVWRAKQIHSDRIVTLDGAGSLPPSESVEADAVITDRQNQAIAVQTADCVPILMVAPDVSCVAAVHAGWRGTAENIVEKVVSSLVEEKGADLDQIHVAIGPCISAQRYEVGEEVAQHFFGENHKGKYHLDLMGANQEQLLACGLLPGNIDIIDLCTFDRDDLFYSYRRDGEGTGRQISWIELL